MSYFPWTQIVNRNVHLIIYMLYHKANTEIYSWNILSMHQAKHDFFFLFFLYFPYVCSLWLLVCLYRRSAVCDHSLCVVSVHVPCLCLSVTKSFAVSLLNGTKKYDKGIMCFFITDRFHKRRSHLLTSADPE